MLNIYLFLYKMLKILKRISHYNVSPNFPIFINSLKTSIYFWGIFGAGSSILPTIW